MFSLSARYYDAIYSFKDYQAEAAKLTDIINAKLRSGGHRLLDVACGTGQHLKYLKSFDAEGLDLDAQLLAIARERNPGMALHQADMTNFDLGRQFDVVTCLFSSIGYTRTLEKLKLAATSMARHLVPGGLLIIEPWFTPDDWHPNTVHALYIDEPELKIARVNTSFAKGRLSYFDLHYLIGTPEGTEHVVEHHELGLFTKPEMHTALVATGLEVSYDGEGLVGRGLYLGLRPV